MNYMSKLQKRRFLALAARPKKEMQVPDVSTLNTKYEKLCKGHGPLYAAALRAYYTFGAITESMTVKDTGLASMLARSNFTNPNNSLVSGLKQLNLTAQEEHGSYIEIKDNYVETALRLEPIKMWMGINYNKEAEAQLQKAIRLFIPDFSLPTRVVREEFTDSNGATRTARVLDGLEGSSYIVSMENLAVLKLDSLIKPSPSFVGPLGFKLDPEYVNLVKSFTPSGAPNLVFLTFSVNKHASGLYSSTDIIEHGAQLGIVFNVELRIRWPLDYAMYATCASSPQDIIPYLLATYLNKHRKSWVNATANDYKIDISRYGSTSGKKGFQKLPKVTAPARVNHLGNIKADNAKEAPRQPPKARDGFIILGAGEPSRTGDVIWLAGIKDRVDDYVTFMREAYDNETKHLSVTNAKIPRNMPLYLDVHNEMISYVNSVGNVETLSTIGSKPLDDLTIHGYLRCQINAESGMRQFAEFLKELGPIVNRSGSTVFAEWRQKNRDFYFKTFEELDKFLANSKVPIEFVHIGGKPFDSEYVDAKEERAACDFLRAACEVAGKLLDDVNTSFATRLSLKFWVELVTKYAGDFDKFEETYNKSVEINAPVSEEDMDEHVTITNSPGITRLMPHQVRWLNTSEKDPEFAALDVAVGGGKSLALIEECARMLGEGKIKRPIILCPGRLVGSWATEIQKFSKGEINAFPITLASLRNTQQAVRQGTKKDSDEIDFQFLKALLDKRPPNSIIVCGFKFLSVSATKTVIYGTATVERYIRAQFFSDYGVDYLGIDESQGFKNLDSNATQAAAIVANRVKYLRLASGTLVNNTVADLIGQMSLVNPAILGNSKEFKIAYTNVKSEEEAKGSGNASMKADSPAAIRKRLQPYVTVFTAKKRDWAFALPYPNLKMHEVSLNKAQTEMYNLMVTQQIAKIETSAAYAAIVAAGEKATKKKEKDRAQNRLNKLVEAAFAPIEAFVSNPETVENFKQEHPDSKLWVSPKVAKINEILEEHFVTNKDTHKVIIFGYREAGPPHIYKYIDKKWQAVSVLYSAKGNRSTIEKFMRNPNYKILIATEASINTGFNMQFANRLIRLESRWAPGDQEQALGRIFRPDPGQVGRPEIYLDYVVTNHTLEVTKLARYISKATEKAMFDEGENPEFTDRGFNGKGPVVDQLNNPGVLGMDFGTLRTFSSLDKIKPWLDDYHLLESWDTLQFENSKKSPRTFIPIDASQRKTIPGSVNIAKAGGWLPRTPGVEPFVNIGRDRPLMELVSIVQSEKEFGANALDDDTAEVGDSPEDKTEKKADSTGDDDITLIDVNPVEEGQLVDTEFGLGYVLPYHAKTKANPDYVEVNVPGVGKVRSSKGATYVFINKEDEDAARAKLEKAGAKGMPRLPLAAIQEVEAEEKKEEKAPKPGPNQQKADKKAALESPVVLPPTIKAPGDRDIDVDDEDASLEVFSEIIDGAVSLYAYEADADAELLRGRNWKHIPETIYCRIRKKEGFKNLEALVNEAGLKFDAQALSRFEGFLKRLLPNSLSRITDEEYADAVRFMRVETFKPLKQPNNVKFYPMVVYNLVDDEWMLYAFASVTQQPKLRKLVGKQAALCGKLAFDEPKLMFKGVTKAAARAELKALNKIITLIDLNDTLAEISAVKTVK